MNPPKNLIDVIGLLYKWKRPILTVTITAGILSALIALTMPNYYKATTTFYAASPDLSKPSRVFGYSSYDLNYYGTGTDIDRLLTIGFSTELADFLIDSFNLYKHYDLDTSDPKSEFHIKEMISDHYNLKKTEYDAIDLSIEDKDKYMAAEMANAARDRINYLAQDLVKTSQKNVLETFKKSIDQKQEYLNKLDDSLRIVRIKYGIFDTKNQGELLSQMVTETESKLVEYQSKLDLLKHSRGVRRDSILFLKAKLSGLQQKYTELTSPDSKSNYNLAKFNRGKGIVDYLENQYEVNSKQLGYDKIRYEQFKTVYNNPFYAIHLVENASVPTIKSRPKRLIIVLLSMAIALIFSIVVVLLIESYRHVNWKEVFRA